MPIVYDDSDGKWYDTDQLAEHRDRYDTEEEATKAAQRRDRAAGMIPADVWSLIADYVGDRQKVGVDHTYANDPASLVPLASVDQMRHELLADTMATTKLLDGTALRSQDEARAKELKDYFTTVNLLDVAEAFAEANGKNPKPPSTLSAHTKQAYEFRGLRQRAKLKRGEAHKQRFLDASQARGLDVVALLTDGHVVNPEALPQLVSSLEIELVNTTLLGRLAEFLTVEEEARAGRMVVAGTLTAKEWTALGAAGDQVPNAKNIGGDRTTYEVGVGRLVNICTTQQKVVIHRSDVTGNATEAINQLLGKSSPPEVPLNGSVLQVHIMLPYPQFHLGEELDQQVDKLRNDLNHLPEDGEEVVGRRAKLQKMIEAAKPIEISPESLAKEIIANFTARKNVHDGRYVLVLDLPSGRWRVEFPNAGQPVVTRLEPAPLMARLVLELSSRGPVAQAGVDLERAHMNSKLNKRRRGNTGNDVDSDTDM